MGEQEEQNNSCPVDRGRSEEVKNLRNRLMLMAFLPPRAMAMCVSWLLPAPKYVPMALQQPWSVLTSMTPDITED